MNCTNTNLEAHEEADDAICYSTPLVQELFSSTMDMQTVHEAVMP